MELCLEAWQLNNSLKTISKELKERISRLLMKHMQPYRKSLNNIFLGELNHIILTSLMRHATGLDYLVEGTVLLIILDYLSNTLIMHLMSP
jgi:hypothetical protein